jgi:hypothetical protein
MTLSNVGIRSPATMPAPLAPVEPTSLPAHGGQARVGEGIDDHSNQ